MIDLTISSVIGWSFVFWLTGYGIGKTWSFFRKAFKRATGTY